MSNPTTFAYIPEAETWQPKKTAAKDKHAKKATRTRRKSKRLSPEDMEIVAALEATRSDMEFLHNCFDNTTDQVLIDSLVYELKAMGLKYQYYLNLCKEKGIVCGAMPES